MKSTRVLLVAGVLLATVAVGDVGIAAAGGGVGEIAAGRNVGGNFDLYTVNTDGTGMRRLTDDPGFDACPDYSRDGSQIAFCSNRSGSFEIWTMRQDGSRQHQLTDTGGFLTFPDWSPNGKRIAFCGSLDPDAPTGDIWVVNADGQRIEQLTDDPSDDCFPTYSPDGSRILFISDRTGVPEIWIMNANGRNERQLTFDGLPKDQVPEWSPDGRTIAYAADNRIWLMQRDGSDQHPITDLGGGAFGAAFSPDGDEIAFLHDVGAGRNLFIVRTDGTGARQVGTEGGYLVPSWRPRG